MKTRILLTALMLTSPMLAQAQAGRLMLPDFSSLSGKAKETVDINLDGSMLQTAGQFMGGQSGSAPAEVKEMLQGVQGIYIRVFQFETPNAYSQGDLDGVRRQLQTPGWNKLMSVNSKDERVDIFMRDPGANPADGGMAILVSEPTELVIVNIVGKVDLEKLRNLQGKFGVPAMPGAMGPDATPPAPSGKEQKT
jgi:hypothetical protein